MRRDFIRLFFLCVTLIWACDHPFSYSPFQVNIPQAKRNTTALNLQRIAALDTISSDTVRIALLSDTHYHFDDLKDALEHINKRNDLAFIIVTGDISENGLQTEFELFHSLMSRSRLPYLTVIGNHDYLANGAEVYKQLFGPCNYVFEFHGTRFVMWDDVAWESNKTPDWKWLEDALKTTREEEINDAKQIITFSHIPPFDSQVSDSVDAYHNLMARYRVKNSIHGHFHDYKQFYFGSYDVKYTTIGSPQKRAYAELVLTRETSTVRQVKF